MAVPPRLVCDVTGHGFGHLGQVAPVLAALHTRRPDLRLVLRTHMPPEALRRFLAVPFESAPPAPDIGLVSHDPFTIDAEASAAAYRALHADWEGVVAAETVRLAALRPDLVLSNVGYVGLTAAARLGVPALALSSLNWADLVESYCRDQPGIAAAVEEIRAAYRTAHLFIQAEPHMPMAWLAARRTVGPLARIGTGRQAALRQAFPAGLDERIVLVSFGGVPGRQPWDFLPQVAGIRWLIGEGQDAGRTDIRSIAELGLSFIDALTSCDAVLTKTGYGTFAEAACNGTRVLYVARPDWPESPYLEPWLATRVPARPIDRQAFEDGAFVEPLRELLAAPLPLHRPAPASAATAALVAGFLPA